MPLDPFGPVRLAQPGRSRGVHRFLFGAWTSTDGWQASPAKRRYSAWGTTPRGGGDDLPADDRADRCAAWQAATDRRGAGAHAGPVSVWLELVTPVNATVARPLIEGLRNPTITREERLRELVFELTSFDVATRKALAPTADRAGCTRSGRYAD
jgi:hypothetical protein